MIRSSQMSSTNSRTGNEQVIYQPSSSSMHWIVANSNKKLSSYLALYGKQKPVQGIGATPNLLLYGRDLQRVNLRIQAHIGVYKLDHHYAKS